MGKLADEAEEALGRDPRLAHAQELVAELYGEGQDLAIDGGQLVIARRPAPTDRERDIGVVTGHLRLAIVSDTHLGSRYEQLTALRAFYRWADEQEVDAFVHGGDLTQGSDRMHRDQPLNVHAHGADAQTAYAVAVYPKSERGTPTYIITGNHDDAHLADGGSNVVRAVCTVRPDLIYLGQDAAYLTAGPLRMYVVHPDGGGAYAISYKPQKITESLPVEKRVALALIGHYHRWGMFRVRQCLALMLPCFQSQYSWLARKALHPEIGGIVLDIALDETGLVLEAQTRARWYEPLEDDWDRDVSAEVGRGWTSRGLTVP